MRNIIVVNFEQGKMEVNAYDKVWQYDYGQTLRIQGLKLPRNVEIHFATQRTGGIALPRVGVTRDGVTDVVIPDSMLENGDATSDYPVYAFVYLTDETSGQTEYMIRMQIKSRPRPEVPGGSEDSGAFHEAVQEVRKLTEKATESERQAEGWAHGREDLPERNEDNAKYYAEKASEDAKKTTADRTAVESVVQDVTQMQGDVARDLEQVQKLSRQAQTSATNAALSEQAAKTSETNAQIAQTGAEIAEANAELAERNAKASEQAVEKAKQLVAQMGQEVLDNKNHVDQTVHNFELTTQQALADVNNAGQTQTERVQGAGNTAVESVKTAQNTATKAVETAKTEAVESVQTEGTAQTGNVTKEGEKQVEAVQAAAQEIVADREQIQTNKAGIEALKQGKADAIVETASGETIQAEDSSGLGFEGLRIFGKSTQDGTPSVENTVPIVNVGDKGTIEVEVTGKNLFNPENDLFVKDYIKSNKRPKFENGILYCSGKTGNSFEIMNAIKVTPGKTYTLSYEIVTGKKTNANLITFESLDINSMPINKTAYVFSNTKYTITIPKKHHYIAFSVTGDDYYSVGIQVQLEHGSIVTPYAEYHSHQSLTIQTPNGLPGIKVDSDGNYTDSNGQQWICDEIDLGRGKYVQRVGKYIFDGTEFTQDTWLPTIVVLARKDIKVGLVNRLYKILSNYGNINFSNDNGNSFGFETSTWNVNNGGELSLLLKRKYDLGKPVVAQYILKTPIENDLDPETIKTYKALHTNYPTTVISNDESAHMEVSYVADTKNYIAKVNAPLQKQITELQNALISQKISGGGIKVSNSARVPMIKFGMWGKTEQVQTIGAQLFDVNKSKNGFAIDKTNGAELDYGSTWVASDYIKIEENTNYSANHDSNYGNTGFAFYSGDKSFISGIPCQRTFLTPPDSKYIRVTIYNANDYSKKFILNKGLSPLPYEPYSGGFPSPSPDWKQPIEVTDRPVTITIKGGTEQQSITLVPPRPLTKWDKLEKIDGVWQWVYQSKACMLSDIISLWEEYRGKGLNQYYFKYAESFYEKNKNNIYADKFKSIILNERLNNYGTVYLGSDSVCFNVNESEFPTLKSWKDWVSANPVNILYKTKETEYIPLPQSEQDKLNSLTMYAPTTEITNDGGCQMELTYTVDTKSYVDKKIAEISTAIL